MTDKKYIKHELESIIDIQKLCDYLGLNVSTTKHINCINPAHNDSTASMNIFKENNTLGCFGCGIYYNPIQVYEKVKNVSYQEAVKDLENLTIQLKSNEWNSIELSEDSKLQGYKYKLAQITINDFSSRINDYFISRNLKEGYKNILKCGYNMGIDDNENICFVFDELIIEVTGSYPKYKNHGKSTPIILNRYDDKAYMIVEGIIDGLTALELGFNAIVLNGVGNVSKIQINENCEYIIALDRDVAGVKKFDKLEKKLCNCNFTYYEKLYLSRCKDLNELSWVKSPKIEIIDINDRYLPEYIINRALQHKHSLLIAPTGIGKTTAIFNYSLSHGDQKTKYVITCPNKIQNTQNEYSFEGVQAIIKGVKIDFNVNVYSVVYDRADEVVKKLKEQGFKVIFIIDESHNLIYQKNFRKKAVKKLLIAEHIADKSLRTTATADTIFNDDYDYIISIPNRELNVKHTKVLSLKGNRKGNLINILDENISEFDKTIVYTDNKELQDTIQDKFTFDVLNADNDLDSRPYKEITINETITNNLVTTSVLQAGSNINLPGEKVLFIYHCNSVKDLSYEKIIQAVSRVRTGVDTLIITIGELREDKIKSYAEFRALLSSNIDKKLKDTKKYIHKIYKENPNVSDLKFDDYIDKEILEFNNSYDKYDNKHSLNAIDFLNVDYFEVEKLTMDEYNKQFYYNGEALLEKLNLNGEVIEYVAAVAPPKGESKMIKGREKFELYKELLSNMSSTHLSMVLENPIFAAEFELFNKEYSDYNKELFTIRKYTSDSKYIQNLVAQCNTVKDLKELKFIFQYNTLEELYRANDAKIDLRPFGSEYKIIRNTLKLKSRISNKKKLGLMEALNIDDSRLNTILNRIYNISNNKPTSLKILKK